MKVCKNCGEINTNDCEYCVNCGKTAFVFHEEIPCPHCGASNDKSFVHCINCGNSLSVERRVEDVVDFAAPSNASAQPEPTPIPVDLREQMTDVYGGLTSAPPVETAQCTNCGALVPIHAIYCQKCGASVASLHEHRVVKRRICPHCGKPNNMESRFCMYCFCSLNNSDTQEMQVVHAPKNIGNDIVKMAYVEDEHGKKKICASCGALNSMDELFCVNCGFKLDPEEQKKYCPNCGAENSVEDTFCTRCQWSFNGDTPDSQSKWECPNCQNAIDDKYDFCLFCGAKKPVIGRK